MSQFQALNSTIVNGTGLLTARGARCHLRKTGNQAITVSTNTPIAWDAEVSDSEGWHDNSTNNTRVTVDLDGLYHCALVVKWNTDVTPTSGFDIDGTGDFVDMSQARFLAGSVERKLFEAWFDLSAGSYIEALVFYGTGGSESVVGGSSAEVTNMVVTRPPQ
jgi:hypothetical protein